MTYIWRRQSFTSADYIHSQWWIDARGSGDKYVRTRFRWGFYGDTSTTIDMAAVAANTLSFGLCTTIGNGSETPPDPITHSGDVAPPTQRWIYWETRSPVVTAIDAAAGVITWRDSGSTEETQTDVQVLATGLPAGESLNLWAVWSAPLGWDFTGSAVIWMGISDLVFQP